MAKQMEVNMTTKPLLDYQRIIAKATLPDGSLRYPQASKECPAAGSVHALYDCLLCGGTERVPTVDPLRVAEELAKHGEVHYGRDANGWWVGVAGYSVAKQHNLATALCAVLVEADGLKRNE